MRVFSIFRRFFRFFIVLFTPFGDREDCQGALQAYEMRSFLGVPKLPVLTLGDRRITDVDATSLRRRLTLKRCRSVGDWPNVRTKVSNANVTNRLVRIGNFRNPSGPIRRLLLGSVVVSSEKYFNGGSRFKFAFARHTGLIASISTGDTSTER